jgi:hypothetical protein
MFSERFQNGDCRRRHWEIKCFTSRRTRLLFDDLFVLFSCPLFGPRSALLPLRTRCSHLHDDAHTSSRLFVHVELPIFRTRGAKLIRRKAKAEPSRFDSCRPAVSSPLKSAHLKYPAHYDPILTSSFASTFRFVRTPLRGGNAPARQPAGGGGEKNRVPCCQPALGSKTACRVDRC